MDWDKVTDKFGIFGDRVGKGLKNVFGSRNDRVVRTLEPIVQRVAELEEWAQGLSQEDFKAKTEEYRAAVTSGERDLEDLMAEAFALVREASVRTLGLRHFDVQIVGGVVLHRGQIAEMMTGEGKTLVATLPFYLNALTGKPCFLVTVNDYLARRDAAWMAPILNYLGLTVGAIQAQMSPWDRQAIYDCDIVYGTNSEFGFDYLRDNMKTRVEEQVQKDLYYAIVDEVDSILIDEARTPLIISGPAEAGSDKYKLADKIARELVRDEHYEVKEKERAASLLEAGIEIAEKMVGVDSFYTPGNEDWPHYIENAIKAHGLYQLDKEYVVEPGEQGVEVVIVDEFTGRKMSGRRWSDGLHQAVEVKEGLEPRKENQTLATITYQNYFRMFDKLAGMTGTALTEAGEFHKIYALDVVSVPTNEPLAREDGVDTVYRTTKEKWTAICDEIERLQEKGQPALVGTTSVEKSEELSAMLGKRGIKHEVLNAKNHEREANIVAMAGDRGAVTVATNMAGRGTDIKLGGNFEYRLKLALDEAKLVEGDVEHLEAIDRIREEVKTKCDADEKDVQGRGGLYVLGTERHEARRIDNQLRGRSGRQGNAGESRFYLSLQDDLMRIFYRDWVTNFMEKLGMAEGQPIESGMVSRAIEKAQKKVEDRNFEIRKHLLEYDEVMDTQRKAIYEERQKVLEGRDTKETVLAMFDRAVDRSRLKFIDDAEGLQGWFLRSFAFELSDEDAKRAVDSEGAGSEKLIELIEARYEERQAEYGEELMRRLESYVLLNAVDTRWKDHLHAVDALKAGIGLRGYGQVDPKNEYKREGAELFLKLFEAIEDEVSSLMLRIQVAQRPAAGEAAAGGGGGALQPRGMYGGAVGTAAPPRRRAAVSSSRAFDLMRRRQVMHETMEERQKAREVKAEEAATAEPQASQPEAAAQPAAPAVSTDQGPADQATPEEGPAEEAPRTEAEAEPALPPLPADVMAAASRNDPCPCGSGKKFKKCHGAGA